MSRRGGDAHNGGRATPELALQAHGLAIRDGLIHIMPDDVRRLFNLLKGKVRTLVEKARTKPQFQRKRPDNAPHCDNNA